MSLSRHPVTHDRRLRPSRRRLRRAPRRRLRRGIRTKPRPVTHRSLISAAHRSLLPAIRRKIRVTHHSLLPATHHSLLPVTRLPHLRSVTRLPRLGTKARATDGRIRLFLVRDTGAGGACPVPTPEPCGHPPHRQNLETSGYEWQP
jgi:hypothetical protein